MLNIDELTPGTYVNLLMSDFGFGIERTLFVGKVDENTVTFQTPDSEFMGNRFPAYDWQAYREGDKWWYGSEGLRLPLTVLSYAGLSADG